VYNCITNTCFADNTHDGLVVQGGKGMEITGNIFVRNKNGLILDRTERARVIGGTFETDPWGGKREDKALCLSKDSTGVVISGATFNTLESGIPTGILYSGEMPTYTACTFSGELSQLVTEIVD